MSAAEDLSEIECPPYQSRHHRGECQHRGAAFPPCESGCHRHSRRTDPEVPTKPTPEDWNGHRSLGDYWKCAKTGRLWQAEHQIHVLDRLTGRTFDQVVLRRQNEREIGSLRAVNGNAHAGGFSLMVACDMAVAADDATFGLPEAAKGLFPFLALAIVKDALPKKVLFEIVYRARLMDAAEAQALHLINEAVARGALLDRAVAIAEQASRYDANIIRLGRDLYHNMRGLSPAQALEESGFALVAALAAADEGTRRD